MTSKKIVPSYRKFENTQIHGHTYQVTSMLHAYFCVAVRPTWRDCRRTVCSARGLFLDGFGDETCQFIFNNEDIENFFFTIEDIIYPEISYADFRKSEYYQLLQIVENDVDSYQPTLYEMDDGLYVEVTNAAKKLKIRFCQDSSEAESYAFDYFLKLAVQYHNNQRQTDDLPLISEFLAHIRCSAG